MDTVRRLSEKTWRGGRRTGLIDQGRRAENELDEPKAILVHRRAPRGDAFIRVLPDGRRRRSSADFRLHKVCLDER